MYQAGGRPHLSSRQPKSKDFGKRSTSTGSSKNDGSIREVPRLRAVLGGSHPRDGLPPRARPPRRFGDHTPAGEPSSPSGPAAPPARALPPLLMRGPASGAGRPYPTRAPPRAIPPPEPPWQI